MRFDSAAQAYFFKCAEWLKSLSETANASDQGAETNGEHPPVLPDQAHWKQIQKLQHGVFDAIKQVLHALLEANPEQARNAAFFLRGMGNQLSDKEAFDLIQAVEQLSARQKKFKVLHEGVEHVCSVVVRQRMDGAAAAKNDGSASSRSRNFQPPNANGTGDHQHNSEDETQESAVEPEAAATAKGSIVPSSSATKDLPEVDSPSSVLAVPVSAALGGQKDSGAAPDKLPSDKPPSLEKSKRVAKVYSEVEHPDALVRELRERYQVSQESFANQVHVSFATVNRWENGHTIPRRIAIARLKHLTKNLGDRGEDLLEKYFPKKFKKQRKKQSLDCSKR